MLLRSGVVQLGLLALFKSFLKLVEYVLCLVTFKLGLVVVIGCNLLIQFLRQRDLCIAVICVNG